MSALAGEPAHATLPGKGQPLGDVIRWQLVERVARQADSGRHRKSERGRLALLGIALEVRGQPPAELARGPVPRCRRARCRRRSAGSPPAASRRRYARRTGSGPGGPSCPDGELATRPPPPRRGATCRPRPSRRGDEPRSPGLDGLVEQAQDTEELRVTTDERRLLARPPARPAPPRGSGRASDRPPNPDWSVSPSA